MNLELDEEADEKAKGGVEMKEAAELAAERTVSEARERNDAPTPCGAKDVADPGPAGREAVAADEEPSVPSSPPLPPLLPYLAAVELGLAPARQPAQSSPSTLPPPAAALTASYHATVADEVAAEPGPEDARLEVETNAQKECQSEAKNGAESHAADLDGERKEDLWVSPCEGWAVDYEEEVMCVATRPAAHAEEAHACVRARSPRRSIIQPAVLACMCAGGRCTIGRAAMTAPISSIMRM